MTAENTRRYPAAPPCAIPLLMMASGVSEIFRFRNVFIWLVCCATLSNRSENPLKSLIWENFSSCDGDSLYRKSMVVALVNSVLAVIPVIVILLSVKNWLMILPNPSTDMIFAVSPVNTFLTPVIYPGI